MRVHQALRILRRQSQWLRRRPWTDRLRLPKGLSVRHVADISEQIILVTRGSQIVFIEILNQDIGSALRAFQLLKSRMHTRIMCETTHADGALFPVMLVSKTNLVLTKDIPWMTCVGGA